MNFMLSMNTADEIGQQLKRCFHRPGMGYCPIEVLRLRRFPKFPLFYPYAVLMSGYSFFFF